MQVIAYYLPVLKSATRRADIRAWQGGPHARTYERSALEYEIAVMPDSSTDERGRPTAIQCTFARSFTEGKLPSLIGGLVLKDVGAIRWLGLALVDAADAMERERPVSLYSPRFREGKFGVGW